MEIESKVVATLGAHGTVWVERRCVQRVEWLYRGGRIVSAGARTILTWRVRTRTSTEDFTTKRAAMAYAKALIAATAK